MKIRFIKSPTGNYGLAYNEGETAILEDGLAKELCEKGFAGPIFEKEGRETATDKTVKRAETR